MVTKAVALAISQWDSLPLQSALDASDAGSHFSSPPPQPCSTALPIGKFSLPSCLSVFSSLKTYLEAELDQDPGAKCAMDVSRPHPLHKDPQPDLEL